MASTGALDPATQPVWRPIAGGISIALKVQPRARRPGMRGVVQSPDGPRLRIAISEVAEDGKANRATCLMLARALGVPPSAVRIAAGGASRDKIVHVAGNQSVLVATLGAL